MVVGSRLADRNIRSLEDMHLSGRRVLLRVDFNTPLTEDGEVADDARIVAALPTIRAIHAEGGRVIACSHLGRPKGKRAAKFSLEPAATRLAELLDTEVLLPDDCVGEAAQHLVANQRSGQVVLLENLRFHAGETANNEDFARRLAELAEVYVNDAFGALHRQHASVDALPRLMPDRCAGLLIGRELEFLAPLVTGADAPYVAILGGAKISGKIDVIERMLEQVHALIIGGAMANTFIAAAGDDMGDSLVEVDRLPVARHLLQRCAAKGIAVFLPVDHLVADAISADATTAVMPRGAVGPGRQAVDIGPETIELFRQVLAGGHPHMETAPRTVFWNGPMGVFEIDAFAAGTLAVARALTRSSAITIIGGGDSAAAVRKAGVTDLVSHVSTGGGASLEFLGGAALPGLAALRGGRR